jgi:hypothetical protein
MGKTIEVSDETWEKIKEVVADEGYREVEIDSLDDFVGEKLFVRTVTYHCVGKVEKRIGKFFELSGASWVADSGRFVNAIKDGTLNEVEPVGKMWLNIDSIVDVFPWRHSLPAKQS